MWRDFKQYSCKLCWPGPLFYRKQDRRINKEGQKLRKGVILGKFDKVQISLIPATPQYSVTCPYILRNPIRSSVGPMGSLTTEALGSLHILCFVLFPFLNNFTVIFSIPFTQSMNFIRCIQLCNHDHHEILEQIHHPLCPLGGSVPASSPGLRQEQSASCFCRFVFSGNFL